jgi:hypothetical protein
VEALLPVLVDEPDKNSVTWATFDGHAPGTVHLGPVANPNRFAARIRFGKVDKIEDRTIYVSVDEYKAQIQGTVSRAAQFLARLPSTIRGLIFLGRVRLIAWWTGRLESDVFWSELGRISG